jgi:hypothetical protein
MANQEECRRTGQQLGLVRREHMPALMYRARRLDDEAHLARLKKEAKVGAVQGGRWLCYG